MIYSENIVPNTKLKIRFSGKRMEVDSDPKCEFGCQVSHIHDKRDCNGKGKSSVPNSKKRGPQASIEGQTEKRQRIERKGSMQCATILKSLMYHQYGWVFSKPVDPVALNIPDYFTIISHPMDFGTIKTKLETNIYSGIEEFAADVRLTFSNAMIYNPPSNDVHLMAKELSKIFDRKWKDWNRKLKCEDDNGNSMTETIKETGRKSPYTMHSRPKHYLSKKTRVSEQERIHKIRSLSAKYARVEAPTLSQIPCKLTDLFKGSKDNCSGEWPAGSLNACSSDGLVTCKCRICGHTACHCVIPSHSTQVSSDISSEGSEGMDLVARGADTLRQDYLTKCTSPLEKKTDPDSDGAGSSLDSEHLCPSSQHVTSTTDASSGEVWSTHVLPVQLSPKKALRAAMLKSRFADTILKAQQKTLLDHAGKGNSQKMQLEKERLERIQREERARLEAQIRTAEAAARIRAEEESRQQREKDRVAARAAIEKMKRTVDIEHNMEIIKELESLSGCTLSYKAVCGRNGYKVAALETLDKPQFENPLERLGLFIKEEYTADEDDAFLNGGWEEGEIFN